MAVIYRFSSIVARNQSSGAVSKPKGKIDAATGMILYDATEKI